jgi:hypothetical protein
VAVGNDPLDPYVGCTDEGFNDLLGHVLGKDIEDLLGLIVMSVIAVPNTQPLPVPERPLARRGDWARGSW